MKPNLTLMWREWMQHRFAWTLLVLLPLALAVLGLSFGTVDVSVDGEARGIPPALVLTAAAIGITAAVLLVLYSVSGLMTVLGLPRRDHADRSVEFWLSLPVSHPSALGVPMLVHLLVMPLVALTLGLLGGLLTSGLLVARVHGLQAWTALPWGELLLGASALWLRVAVGWPLALLWLSPLILLGMLAYAWMRRWGLVLLGLALAIGSSSLGEILGYRFVPQTLAAITQGAAHALVSGRHSATLTGNAEQVLHFSLQQAPAWVLEDVLGSLQNLASPVFVGGLVVAALCFLGLIQWRRRGASAAV